MPASQDLEPWRKVCLKAGDQTFAEFLSMTAQSGVFFTQPQQELVRLACLTAASQGCRYLAAHPDRAAMIEVINADTEKAIE